MAEPEPTAPGPAGPEPEALPLIAYALGSPPMELVPAPRHREWMARTTSQFAKRCLPMLVANQAGWHLLNHRRLTVRWNGGINVGDLQVGYGDEGPPEVPASSRFGHGIITWTVPYLFRTPPGYNLLVRGPANEPKDGVCALEGLVEADWSTATFTMNWRLTRADHEVVFERDEPIALLVPQRRGELARFEPVVRELDSDPKLAGAYRRWSGSRTAYLKVQRAGLVRPTEWQKDYVRGRLPGGEPPEDRELTLRLRPFRD